MIDLVNLSWVDYAIVGILTFSLLISLVRGFVREAISLLTWVGAFVLAIYFYQPIANVLAPYINHPTMRIAAGFLIILLTILIGGAMVNYVFSQLVKKTGLSGTDRVLGIGFGLGRGVLMVSVLLLLMGWTTMPKTEWWQSSVLIPYFKPLMIWLQSFFPHDVNLG